MTWLPLIGATVVAAALLILPGGIALLAAAPRRWTAITLAPPVSVAIIATSAIVAGLLGVRWSVWAVLAMTAATWGIARLVRWAAERRSANGVASDDGAPQRAPLQLQWPWALAGLAIAAVLIGRRFPHILGTPEAFSQTFDNIFHLNAVRHVVETGEGSALLVGRLTGVGFYPAAWHNVAALVAELTGASVPLAANAMMIAVAAVVWPLSALALTAVVRPGSRAALVVAGAAAAAFGAFPLLLVSWGVLYPNALSVAMLPAAVALSAVLLLRPQRSLLTGGAVSWPVELLALVAVVGGLGVAHPQGMLAWLILTLVLGILTYVQWLDAHRTHTRAAIVARTAAVVLGVVAVLGVLQVVRPPADQAWWPVTMTTPQALGEALTVSPAWLSWTWPVAAVMWIGLWVALRDRSARWLAALFLTTVVLYVIAVSGVQWLRDFITAVWNNDSNRLAAMLPLAAVPLVAIGGAWLYEKLVAAVDAVVQRRRGSRPATGASRGLRAGVAIAAALVAVVASQGDNVRYMEGRAAGTFVVAEDSSLVSTDELALIERLDETVPADALIIGSPRTGASFAFALGDRQVVPVHIFGPRTNEVLYLARYLDQIDTRPAVCAAVERSGVDYVLDFGTRDLQGRSDTAYDGLVDLPDSAHLELVDSEGPDARLFRIVC